MFIWGSSPLTTCENLSSLSSSFVVTGRGVGLVHNLPRAHVYSGFDTKFAHAVDDILQVPVAAVGVGMMLLQQPIRASSFVASRPCTHCYRYKSNSVCCTSAVTSRAYVVTYLQGRWQASYYTRATLSMASNTLIHQYVFLHTRYPTSKHPTIAGSGVPEMGAQLKMAS